MVSIRADVLIRGLIINGPGVPRFDPLTIDGSLYYVEECTGYLIQKSNTEEMIIVGKKSGDTIKILSSSDKDYLHSLKHSETEKA